MDIGLIRWDSMSMHFWQCIAFHPHNLVNLCLWQHLQGASMGSVFSLQLRSSDILVSPDILRWFWWFPYWIRL